MPSSRDGLCRPSEAVYRHRNPYKLEAVPTFLERYAGDEMTLYRKVCRAYLLDPTKLYADEAAWEDEELRCPRWKVHPGSVSIGLGRPKPNTGVSAERTSLWQIPRAHTQAPHLEKLRHTRRAGT